MSACTKHAAEPVRGYSDCPGCEVENLRQQLAAAQAEVRELQRVQSDVLANLDAPDDMDVISAAHFVAGSLSTAEEALEAAQAEARELRAELARVRELPAKWRAAPQNPDEPLLAIAADELDAALSQPAEQHDPLAVSDHCGECGEHEPECACDERIEDYRPAAQESDQ